MNIAKHIFMHFLFMNFFGNTLLKYVFLFKNKQFETIEIVLLKNSNDIYLISMFYY
jgi:hypothetical protein